MPGPGFDGRQMGGILSQMPSNETHQGLPLPSSRFPEGLQGLLQGFVEKAMQLLLLLPMGFHGKFSAEKIPRRGAKLDSDLFTEGLEIGEMVFDLGPVESNLGLGPAGPVLVGDGEFKTPPLKLIFNPLSNLPLFPVGREGAYEGEDRESDGWYFSFPRRPQNGALGPVPSQNPSWNSHRPPLDYL